MFARGRSGPSRSTPANVQCQKCLKRGHYSYECKESVQARPYATRPSRSQQLRNPKLIPKLTNETLDPLEKKKGVADEELAKKEAERARKRDLDEQDEEFREPSPKRRRSVSSASTSSRSSDASSQPRPQLPSGSSQRGRQMSQDDPPGGEDSRSRNDSRSRSRTPPPRRSRSFSPDDRSPPRQPEASHRERRHRSPRDHRSDRRRHHHGRYSPDAHDGHTSRRHREYSASRSPDARPRRNDREAARGMSGRDGPSSGRAGGYRGRQESPPRERSLSPFSKRLALTQARNSGQT